MMLLLTYLAILSSCFLLSVLMLLLGMIKYKGNCLLEAMCGLAFVSFIFSIPSFIIMLFVKFYK